MADAHVTRVVDLLAQLAAAKEAVGAAVLDGRERDYAAVAAIEQKINAEELAEIEQTRRGRTAKAAAQATREGQLRNHIAGLGEEYLDAIEQAEEGDRTKVEGVSRALEIAKKLTAAAYELAGSAAPLVFQPLSVAGRIGGRSGAVHSKIPGHPARIGGLEYRAHSLYRADTNWRDAEHSLIVNHLQPLFKKDKLNGK